MRVHLWFCAALLLPCCGFAAEAVPVDDDLPQPFAFDSKSLSAMRTHSPFNRFVSLEDTFQLTGVAYIEGKAMATLVNKETKQRFVVSDEPNALGWKLTEATVSEDPRLTEVHLMIGPDEVVLHYGGAQLAPSNAKNNTPELASKKSNTSSSQSRPVVTTNVNVPALLGNKGKELFQALPPEGREKLAGVLQASMAKHPERTTEQNEALAQKLYSKYASAASKPQGNDSSKTPRPSKPNKKPKP